MPDKSELLLGCAPITEKPGMDRAMRVAINRVRHGKKAATFGHQQAFDAAIAKLVRDIPVDEQLAEWFVNENLIPVVRRGWKKIVRNPVLIAIAIALLVIAAVTQRNGVCFMAALRGSEKDLRIYLEKKKQ